MNNTALPVLHDTIQLPESQILDFRKKGHTLVKGLLKPEEVSSFRQVINDAAYRYNTEKRKLAERDTYGKAFLQIMNLWEVDDQVREFSLSRRFAQVAADLLGVKNVRLYHDQALYKEPGGGFTPWHQDQYYWPLNTNNTVTMWMPLINITEDLGMLTFASESQNTGFAENIAISDESETLLEKFIKDKGFEISRPKSMDAGDATWHYGWTLHSAPGNLSEHVTREIMTVIFFADGAEVVKPQNKHQEADRQRWLGGLNPGDAAASKMNPLLL